jgi:hypothetical protein
VVVVCAGVSDDIVGVTETAGNVAKSELAINDDDDDNGDDTQECVIVVERNPVFAVQISQLIRISSSSSLTRPRGVDKI